MGSGGQDCQGRSKPLRDGSRSSQSRPTPLLIRQGTSPPIVASALKSRPTPLVATRAPSTPALSLRSDGPASRESAATSALKANRRSARRMSLKHTQSQGRKGSIAMIDPAVAFQISESGLEDAADLLELQLQENSAAPSTAPPKSPHWSALKARRRSSGAVEALKDLITTTQPPPPLRVESSPTVLSACQQPQDDHHHRAHLAHPRPFNSSNSRKTHRINLTYDENVLPSPRPFEASHHRTPDRFPSLGRPSGTPASASLGANGGGDDNGNNMPAAADTIGDAAQQVVLPPPHPRPTMRLAICSTALSIFSAT